MNAFVTGLLSGSLGVIVFDTAGSILSIKLKFWYGKLSPGSFILWTAAAGISSRHSSDVLHAAALGCATGLIVGLVDSTLGWWISLRIGAAKLGPSQSTKAGIARTIAGVTTTVGLLGILGGFITFSLGQ
jgi:hypothetical protein